MPQMCGTRPPIPASHLHELTGNMLAKLNNYFYFSKQWGEKRKSNFHSPLFFVQMQLGEGDMIADGKETDDDDKEKCCCRAIGGVNM